MRQEYFDLQETEKAQEESTPLTFRGKPYWININLKKNLQLMKDEIKNDWDFPIIIDGVEGAGKSVLAQQIAAFLDPDNFGIDDICLSSKEWKNRVLQKQRYGVTIYDEGITGLSARETMSHTNKTLVSMMAQIRQKNLYSIIVLPTFFDLDKNIALWRAKALIHVVTEQGFKRGKFLFYNKERKTKLYIYGKKDYNYRIREARPIFVGKFPPSYMVNETEYRAKKLAGFEEQMKRAVTSEEAYDKLQTERDECVRFLYSKGVSMKNVALILRRNEHYVEKILGRDAIDIMKNNRALQAQQAKRDTLLKIQEQNLKINDSQTSKEN